VKPADCGATADVAAAAVDVDAEKPRDAAVPNNGAAHRYTHYHHLLPYHCHFHGEYGSTGSPSSTCSGKNPGELET